MTNEEAARILDPETSREALAEIEYYGGFCGMDAVIEASDEACRIAAEALRQTPPAQIEREAWISVEDRLPAAPGEYLVVYHPCYWDSVRPERRVGMDTFRGKTAWAKKKYQRVTHWMPLPEPPESRPPEGEEGNQ